MQNAQYRGAYTTVTLSPNTTYTLAMTVKGNGSDVIEVFTMGYSTDGGTTLNDCTWQTAYAANFNRRFCTLEQEIALLLHGSTPETGAQARQLTS